MYKMWGGGEPGKVSFEMFYREKILMWSKTDNFEGFQNQKQHYVSVFFSFSWEI